MASYLENLVIARDNFAAALATESANPKPSYSVGERSFSWPQYYEFLQGQIDKLNASIAQADGGFDVRAQGMS